MKRRILIALTSVGLLVGVVAAPALAAPYGPARYQVTTNTYTMALGYGHTYTVVMNPCDDGSVTATGWQWGSDGNPLVHNPDETITATLSSDGTMLIFNPAVYVGGWGGSPYSWSGAFPVAGGTFTVSDSLGGVYPDVVITLTNTASTNFKNHGEYVSSMGGGADAAHSCIGMPMKPVDESAETNKDVAAIQARLLANETRLIATLEAVVARLQANAKANAHAVAAIQKHVDALKAGDSGLNRAAEAVGKTDKATTAKPTLPDKAANHPTPGNHPGKP